MVDELGFAPLDALGSQLLFHFVAAAYERLSLGVGHHRPFDQWGPFSPSTPTPFLCSTVSCTTPWWWSSRANAQANPSA